MSKKARGITIDGVKITDGGVIYTLGGREIGQLNDSTGVDSECFRADAAPRPPQKFPMTVRDYLRAFEIPMDAMVLNNSLTRCEQGRSQQLDTICWTHPTTG